LNFQFANLFPIEYDSDKDFTKIHKVKFQELARLSSLPRKNINSNYTQYCSRSEH
jgi:hypothetical protein